MPVCSKRTFLYTICQGDTPELIARRYHTSVYAIAAANPGTDLDNLNIGQKIYIRSKCEITPHDPCAGRTCISNAEAALSNHLRLLWEQHVVWTRLVIMSIVFSLPDADLATSRLLRNPRDFEEALRPLYGTRAAYKFAALLTDHLIIAAQLVKAAKAGNDSAAADAEKKWYANADEIAVLLGSINPYWSEDEWRKMLYEHLALTKAEAVSMLTQNYAEGISLFDEIEKQALEMADMMTYGIIRQFPQVFAE